MKNYFLFIFCCITFINAFSQKEKYSLEIKPFIRYYKYDEFLSWQTGIGGNHFVKPSGASPGIYINIKKQIKPRISIYLGLGYYRHTISTVESRSDLGAAQSRLIQFQSPLFISFYTDKYRYNTLTANIGFEKRFDLSRSCVLKTGVTINGLYTFSQYYHLTSNPEGSQDYRKHNASFMGVLSGLDIGFIKGFKQFTIGPVIQLPLISHLKTDDTFPNETGADYRNQWFSGIDLGISFIYKLNP